MRIVSTVRALLLLIGCLSVAWAMLDAQAADRWPTVSERLDSVPEETYIGGMPKAMVDLAAEARLRLQSWWGESLPSCGPPNPLQGEVVVTGVGVDRPPSKPQTNPLFGELQQLLRHERPFVRDAAAFIIGEIGPAASVLEPDLSGTDVHRSPWFTHALGRVCCQAYSMNSGIKIIPESERLKLIGREGASLSAALKVQLLAKLLAYDDLIWPDKFFSSFIDDWVLRDKEGALAQIEAESVLAIADRLMDETTPGRLREDLVELLESLGRAAGPAASRLWHLAQGPDDTLAYSAAHTLIDTDSAHALDAAVLLLKRFEGELSMLPKTLCSVQRASEVLGPLAKERLLGSNWSEAADAAEWLGCLDPLGNAALLRTSLNHPSWETQIAVIAALSLSAQSDALTQEALRQIQSKHWSGLVRQKAEEALQPPPTDQESTDDLLTLSFNCFHRCLNDHLRRCGDERGIVDGLYVSPSMGELEIEWEHARRVPKPEGFPIVVHEDGRPDYGTSTYLRVEDGWLYGTDLWHYDGDVAFVDDQGQKSELAEWGEDVVAFIETPHFGPVMLGSSLFTVGAAGLLAQVERAGEAWKLVPRVALPSPPWGWAIAPNGTLLVADPYEAVAVLQDGSIESLACPVRSPEPVPRNLLSMAKKAPRSPGPQAQRIALDALKLHESSFLAHRARSLELAKDPSQREVWEKPEQLQGWLNNALNEWMDAFLIAGLAADALSVLDATPGEVAMASPSRRFQIHAAADQPDIARAQLMDASTADDDEALKMQVMLALAEGQTEAAKVALARIQELTDKSTVHEGADPYLPLLQGLATQQWPAPDSSDEDPSAWPNPIRELLAGRSDEDALVLASHTRDGRIDREKLCEALFFSGLKLVNEGKGFRARRHFRAVTQLGVQHFHEHAVAETVLGSGAR